MIRIENRPFFEVWGTEVAQNRFLKLLLAFFALLIVGLAASLTIMSLRKPMVFAVSETKTHILGNDTPKAALEQEIRRVISFYVLHHHSWDWRSVDESLRQAGERVGEDYLPKFREASAPQARIAKERKLSQKFFVEDIAVNSGAMSAKVRGERVIVVDGIHAATPLELDMRYESGPRTRTNPEGIYIVSEEVPRPSSDTTKDRGAAQ